ncbi:hypothetical protein Mapa_004950 [Marchantia paleacea]|nr:hypothetical protein Mapa_004950 [Marchantia paleacea]
MDHQVDLDIFSARTNNTANRHSTKRLYKASRSLQEYATMALVSIRFEAVSETNLQIGCER